MNNVVYGYIKSASFQCHSFAKPHILILIWNDRGELWTTTLLIEVPVTSQESTWSCKYVSIQYRLCLFYDFRLDYGTFWGHFCVSFYFELPILKCSKHVFPKRTFINCYVDCWNIFFISHTLCFIWKRLRWLISENWFRHIM
jgi:hypothetical protein